MICVVRAAKYGVVYVTVHNVGAAIAEYGSTGKVVVHQCATEDGSYAETGTATLVAAMTGYEVRDEDAASPLYYKARLENAAGDVVGEWCTARAYETQEAYALARDLRGELAGGSGQEVIGAERDWWMWEILGEVSRLIDEYKQVPEGAYLATVSEARELDGDGSRHLWLDWPAVSVSLVEVEETDGTWTSWAADDWWTWPYAGDGPITRLDVSDRTSGSKTVWLAGRKRVRVTAVWGVSATAPALVARACKTQGARWWKRALAGWSDKGGGVEFGTLEYVGRGGLDVDVRRVLDVVRPRQTIL